MRVIIAGSRHITDADLLEASVEDSDFDITEVVSGGAKGVDRLGEDYARQEGISITRFPARWERHGRSAGPIRNGEMAEYADALIAIWDGNSSGTRNMLTQAYRADLKMYLLKTDTGEIWRHKPTITSKGNADLW